MSIVEWNILRLADCLRPLIANNKKTTPLLVDDALKETLSSFPQKIYQVFAQKQGLSSFQEGDEALVAGFLRYLEENALDFTVSFSHLDELFEGETKVFPKNAKFKKFLAMWKDRASNLSHIDKINPKLIPRNHQIQYIIDQANKTNYAPMREMWEALRSPFQVSEEHQHLIAPPKPSERIYQTFFGT